MPSLWPICSHLFSLPWMLRDPRPDYQTELFCRKIPVLDAEQASQVKTFFNNQNNGDYFSDERNKRWGLRKSELDQKTAWTVCFDRDGHVVEEEISHPFDSYQHYKSLKKATTIALEAMAKNLGWAGETHEMAMSLMQHQLKGDERSSGIEYHVDDSHYTLVVLLEDAADSSKGWTGGELLFRPDQSPILAHRITPECGHGILFSNQGTQHAVTPFTPRDPSQKWIERTILTLHDYGPIDKPAEKTLLKSNWYYLKVCAENMAHCLYSTISIQARRAFSALNLRYYTQGLWPSGHGSI
jgi:hypothetical protein